MLTWLTVNQILFGWNFMLPLSEILCNIVISSKHTNGRIYWWEPQKFQ